MNIYVQTPDDRLDYDVDFGRKWMPIGDAIQSVIVTVETSGTVVTDGTPFTDTVVKVWVKGGVDGETAHITVEAFTAQGRDKKECFKVRIREC